MSEELNTLQCLRLRMWRITFGFQIKGHGQFNVMKSEISALLDANFALKIQNRISQYIKKQSPLEGSSLHVVNGIIVIRSGTSIHATAISMVILFALQERYEIKIKF